MPARSVVVTDELPCQRPASPEMNESPRVTNAVLGLWGVASAAGTRANDHTHTAPQIKMALRVTDSPSLDGN